MGPNNFPLAYNALCGGDFAGAIAAGNPVIAKGHPSHPETCQRIALCAVKALATCGLDESIVQFFQQCAPEDGLALISDDRVKAVAFTGSRRSGLAIKAAADRCGTPVYLEMSSVNPVFFLPGSTSAQTAQEWVGSIALGGGQFCTKPGLAFTCSRSFAHDVKSAMASLGDAVQLTADHTNLIERFTSAGATVVCGGPSDGFRWTPTLMTVDGTTFEANAAVLSEECFGPVALLVEVDGVAQMERIASRVEGQLTTCVYAREGDDPSRLLGILRSKCGRLLQNKMPTGVTVVASMVHGGPFPATGHPGFTAVGMPTSVVRFAARHCYDNVDSAHLPLCLR
jgi:NADP-dependent aldehyde dehydrogenase